MEWTFECRYCLNPNCLKCWSSPLPDVQVPGVVLVVGDVDPVVVGDDSLVETQDGLVTSLHTSQNNVSINLCLSLITLIQPTLKSLSLVTEQESTASRPSTTVTLSTVPKNSGSKSSPKLPDVNDSFYIIWFGYEFLFIVHFPFLFLVTDWKESDKKLWSLLRNFSFTRI